MGAGRTEVARALVGADPISAGTITLRGRPVRIGSPAEAARHRIGYLSEDRKQLGLLLEQDVTANVVLSSSDRALRPVRVRPLAGDAGHRRELVGLAADQDAVGATRPSRTCPAATSRRSSSPSGWPSDCDMLIFDEPTRGIDVGAKEEIYALLNEPGRRRESRSS